jgi:hypothetical protein
MSFIYDDPNLLNELIKSSLDFTTKFTKHGQLVNEDVKNLNILLNNLLRTSTLSADPNKISFEGTAPAVSPDEVVDVVPQILDGTPKKGGMIQLQLKDIQSPEALNDWLRTNNINILSHGKHVNFNDNDFDMSIVINTLFARAKWFAQRAGVADKAKTSAYLHQIQTLAPTITGLDGKRVQLVGTVNTLTPEHAAATGANAAQLINQIAEFKPLSVDAIDFVRIRQFFDMVQQFLNTSNSPRKSNIENAINRVESQIAMLTSMTKDQDVRIPITPHYQDIVNILKPPVGNAYSSFIRGLQSVVQATAGVVSQIQAGYYDKMGQEAKEAISDQVVGGSSAEAQNLRMLQVYLNNLPNVVKFT